MAELDVSTHKKLQDWLKTQPIAVSRIIATRAALRVLPIAQAWAATLQIDALQSEKIIDSNTDNPDRKQRPWRWRISGNQNGLSDINLNRNRSNGNCITIPLWRISATIWSSSQFPEWATALRAATAESSDGLSSALKSAFHEPPALDRDTVFNASGPASDAAYATFQAASAVVSNDAAAAASTAASTVAYAFRAIASDAAYAAYTANAADSYAAERGIARDAANASVCWDCEAIAPYTIIDSWNPAFLYKVFGNMPLWEDGPPSWVSKDCQNMRDRLERRNEGWEVWIDWYEARLDGKKFDPDIEVKRAKIPNWIWEMQPKALNAYTKQLVNRPMTLLSDAPKAPGASLRRLVTPVRAIFLGHVNAGKTSLINALQDKTVQPGKRVMTPGVAITDVDPHLIWPQPETADDKPKVYFWDFSGQVMAHHTHQFFLRPDCVYVIVLDSDRSNHATEDARYWLEHVRTYGAGSPVLIVGNKIDLAMISVELAQLNHDYNKIVGFFPLSCTGAKSTHFAEFNAFRIAFGQEILATADQVELTNRQHDLLDSLRARGRGASWLKRDEYVVLCRDHGVGGSAGLDEDSLLALLDTLGVVVHFSQIEILDELLLNPEWLTKGVYTILYSGVGAQKQGRLCFEDFMAAFDEKPVLNQAGQPLTYDRQQTGFIVEAMRRFKLCYRPFDEPDQIIVPALLAEHEPVQEVHAFDFTQAWAFRFRFADFMPQHVLPSLMVDRHADIAYGGAPAGNLVWKRGMVLRPERYYAEAFVVLQESNRTLTIHVTGLQAREYVGVLRECVNRSLDKMSHLDVHEEIALTPDMLLDDGDGLPHGAADWGKKSVWAPFSQAQANVECGNAAYIGPRGARYALDKINSHLPSTGHITRLRACIEEILRDRAEKRRERGADKEQAKQRHTAKQRQDVRIFISSPGDCTNERGRIRRLIEQDLQKDISYYHSVHFETVDWTDPHTSPVMPAYMPPQKAIDNGLTPPSECDIVLVMFKHRMGTPLPHPDYHKTDGTPYLSGTEWEYENARRAAEETSGRPVVLLYRFSGDFSVKFHDPERDEKEKQFKQLCDFFERMTDANGAKKTSHYSFSMPKDLLKQVNRHLRKVLHDMLGVNQQDSMLSTLNVDDLLSLIHGRLLTYEPLQGFDKIDPDDIAERIGSLLKALAAAAGDDQDIHGLIADLEALVEA